MPVYHSRFNDCQEMIGNMALLPIKTTFKGPAMKLDINSDEVDIIDEALLYFKPNIFFREFEIKGSGDRTLIYLILYISECLRKILKCTDRIQAQKDLNMLSLNQKIPIPGDTDFPLNGMYKAPSTKLESENMRMYLQQLRQEISQRLLEKVYSNNGAALKWWLCFSKKRFLEKSLIRPGVVF
ncbi:Actin-related protein 2/3 complex subunit 3 [Strongyloides ratti]|uniref:Actin-related protein 2/3 complex subunit 3 n=1 Tax=Strongyloides ratti TaxID=34506 RepID=A0A090MXI3_STRRB|nr:Actin-related protein 2/3 complex subunit 3 [Strongyloides ratti]CEF65484.1 Actin-related protein 2/3 complex subunit 3 [Strongyloides ratti]